MACLMVSTVWAQGPVYAYGPKGPKNLIPVIGGEQGKSYAVILRTNHTKKELVQATVDFLIRYQLVDSDSLKIDEVSEEMSQFTLPISFKQGVYYGNIAAMGIKGCHLPVKLKGTLFFEFYDNGKAMIAVKNLSERTFAIVDKSKMKFNLESEPEFWGIMTAKMMSKSAFTKVAVAMSKGADGLKDLRKAADDYFENINKEYAVYDKLAKGSSGVWMDDDEIITYAENTANSGVKHLKGFKEEGRLLAVSQQRWDDEITQGISFLFKDVALSVGGTIEKIGEDGIDTWENIDGKVLPLDPKLQKEYIKKGMEY